MSFGDRLRMLREDKDVTQKELGNAVGVSDRVIGYYESNDRFPKDESTLKKLADYFNVPADYLLGRVDTTNIDTSSKSTKANSLKDELIELMVKRGLIKDKNNLNEEHLKLIEMSISTYSDRTNNRKQGDEN